MRGCKGFDPLPAECEFLKLGQQREGQLSEYANIESALVWVSCGMMCVLHRLPTVGNMEWNAALQPLISGDDDWWIDTIL